MKQIILQILLVCFLVGAGEVNAQLPAFPGAVGFGAAATGGRGGTVYHIRNLYGSGHGSFRDTASFTMPQTFVSLRRVDTRTVEIGYAGNKLSAPVFTRIGIKLKKPLLTGEVVVTFRPVQ